jgi:hypothetical protein
MSLTGRSPLRVRGGSPSSRRFHLAGPAVVPGTRGARGEGSQAIFLRCPIRWPCGNGRRGCGGDGPRRSWDTRGTTTQVRVSCRHVLFGQAGRVLPVRLFLLDVLEDVGVGLLLPAG